MTAGKVKEKPNPLRGPKEGGNLDMQVEPGVRGARGQWLQRVWEQDGG